MTTEERLRSLLEAANPGEWAVEPYSEGHPEDGATVVELPNRGPVTYGGYEGLDAPCSTEDAALIVEAVNALPKLLAVVAAARAFDAYLLTTNGNIGFGLGETMWLDIQKALAALDAEP